MAISAKRRCGRGVARCSFWLEAADGPSREFSWETFFFDRLFTGRYSAADSLFTECYTIIDSISRYCGRERDEGIFTTCCAVFSELSQQIVLCFPILCSSVIKNCCFRRSPLGEICDRLLPVYTVSRKI